MSGVVRIGSIIISMKRQVLHLCDVVIFLMRLPGDNLKLIKLGQTQYRYWLWNIKKHLSIDRKSCAGQCNLALHIVFANFSIMVRRHTIQPFCEGCNMVIDLASALYNAACRSLVGNERMKQALERFESESTKIAGKIGLMSGRSTCLTGWESA